MAFTSFTSWKSTNTNSQCLHYDTRLSVAWDAEAINAFKNGILDLLLVGTLRFLGNRRTSCRWTLWRQWCCCVSSAEANLTEAFHQKHAERGLGNQTSESSSGMQHGHGASASRGMPVHSPAFAVLINRPRRDGTLSWRWYTFSSRGRDSNRRPRDRKSGTLPHDHLVVRQTVCSAVPVSSVLPASRCRQWTRGVWLVVDW